MRWVSTLPHVLRIVFSTATALIGHDPNSRQTRRRGGKSQEGKAHPTFQPMTKLYIINYQHSIMNLLPIYVMPGR